MASMNFTVDSALLSELGEKLVGSVHVALLELIKNSYDADASQVLVGIYPNEQGGSVLIRDNGLGMTFDEVQNYWMRIATTNKVENKISRRYGRPKSGAKGIGRFSCRRLGNVLTMKTTALIPNGYFQTTKMTIDWSLFKRGTTIEEIQVEYESYETQDGSTGTELLIQGGIGNKVSQTNYSYITRHCAVLVANRGIEREGFIPDPGFNIEFDFPESKEIGTVNLRDKLLNSGWGTVKAYIDGSGQAHFELISKDIPLEKSSSAPKRFPLLKGVRLSFGLLVDRRDQIRDSSILSLGVLREILDEWGGIFIRYKGIRVPPYGEKNDDWLNIDSDRGLRKGASQIKDIVSAIAFAGDTGIAYPFMQQVLFSTLSFRAARTRALDIIEYRSHIIKMLNSMITSIHVDDQDITNEDCQFILAGYSWIKKRFFIWRIGYFKDRKNYHYDSALSICQVPRSIIFAGSDGDSLKNELGELLRERRGYDFGQTPIDLEPLEAMSRLLKKSNADDYVGGPPQMIKIYQYAQNPPVPIEWEINGNKVVTLLGRTLLDYEHIDDWTLNPDNLEKTPPK